MSDRSNDKEKETTSPPTKDEDSIRWPFHSPDGDLTRAFSSASNAETPVTGSFVSQVADDESRKDVPKKVVAHETVWAPAAYAAASTAEVCDPDSFPESQPDSISGEKTGNNTVWATPAFYADQEARYKMFSQPRDLRQDAAESATSVAEQQTNEEMSNSDFSQPGGTEEQPPTDYESQADSGHSGGEVRRVEPSGDDEIDRTRLYMERIERQLNPRK
jgi:hypothetical protein